MTLQDRIAGAVLGSFAADTLSLGVHWIYNPERIARKVGRLEGPLDPLPGAAKYHPNRKRGQFTHYGDQMLVLLRSVAEDDGWSPDGFAQRWRAMWDDYDGYVDKATRSTLESGGSSSDDLAGAARLAPLLVPLADGDEDDFVAAARAQTALSHGDPALLEAGDFFARLLFAVSHGASVEDGLSRALDHAYDAFDGRGHLDAARAQLASASPAAVVAEFGAHCHVPGAVPSTLYLLLKFGHSLEEALVENAMAGGDNAARGLLLGAILGARDGVDAIPAAWLEAMVATDEIRGLLEGSAAPPAGGSRFAFPNAQGIELAGALETPRDTLRGYAVFAHCFTCGKDIAAASRIARALAQRGIAVLRFDFTGLGSSDGDFANTHFSSNVDDLVAAADALRARHAAPDLLIGHSLGGAAVLAAAHRVPEAKGVVTIGAPSEPDHVLHLLEGSRADIERDGQAPVNLAGRTFTIRREFLEDLERHTLAEHIAGLGRSLMIMHAPFDRIVGIDNARQIFEAAKHPKSFLSLDDADHLLSRREDAAYVGAVIAAWGERLLG
jgi:putative redox protein